MFPGKKKVRGLERGVTLSGNIFKISLETYSKILIFC
jgi:hypothetical protein